MKNCFFALVTSVTTRRQNGSLLLFAPPNMLLSLTLEMDFYFFPFRIDVFSFLAGPECFTGEDVPYSYSWGAHVVIPLLIMAPFVYNSLPKSKSSHDSDAARLHQTEARERAQVKAASILTTVVAFFFIATQLLVGIRP